ncbi:MAG: extracellular solute-binding protein [Anaerolineae bacterium]|nr:extracellular solute-binding protein [Anaerolineae bacterium]
MHRHALVGIITLGVIIGLLTGCAGAPPSAAPTPSPAAVPQSQALATPTPAGPVTLTLWHRWPERFAASVRQLLDEFEQTAGIRVEMTYQASLHEALNEARAAGRLPDVVAMPGDYLSLAVETGWLQPAEPLFDPAMLEETYLPAGLEALRYQGHLWGLPLNLHTQTFIYNMDLISEAELSADTAELVAKARQYQAAHPGIWYLVYPARNDVFFAAAWFYGAGAWYAREDGSVGLNTPPAVAAAEFIASLREIMPADIDLTKADALFKAGQAAITINGIWYLAELDAAGIRYGLQIMPVVSASGMPARPLVAADGLMITSQCQRPAEAARLIAYLTNAENALRLARGHSVVPANRLAVQRAGQEGLWIVAHYARQAELGQPLPATPYWPAVLPAVRDALEAIWEGQPPAEALQSAQTAAEQLIASLR